MPLEPYYRRLTIITCIICPGFPTVPSFFSSPLICSAPSLVRKLGFLGRLGRKMVGFETFPFHAPSFSPLSFAVAAPRWTTISGDLPLPTVISRLARYVRNPVLLLFGSRISLGAGDRAAQFHLIAQFRKPCSSISQT